MVRRLDATTGADDGAAADLAAAVFLDEVGGTSGPLFGLLLQDVAAAVHEDADVVAAVAVGLLAGLAAVQRVGEAEPGDRTLVDALHAAVPGLDAADLAEATRAAVTATAATSRLVARMGRASLRRRARPRRPRPRLRRRLPAALGPRRGRRPRGRPRHGVRASSPAARPDPARSRATFSWLAHRSMGVHTPRTVREPTSRGSRPRTAGGDDA
ncbi:hypothetical protein GCM10025868_20310 [Angustibacter aerolatus]|uniref:DhaL domain-containing protein n=1 Tax=Angustibacter aerolatus TaxID=1162965 RepID=A0ABQ6JJ09_9ACTN|nr:DAK2 domain-containing protein [Angustibacter aerolatus]GMA86781.1 hypothetical protein GCM10025868_20310 [Angustibacter aerolatus]